MKLETKIAYLILCLALPLTTACKKTPIPAEDPQPAEVAFAASSQATWVKTTTGEEQPEFPYDNFGVWGIARQEGLLAPYILWGTNSLMLVEEDEDVFVPSEAAYWLKGYTYNFLAVAPLDPTGFNLTEVKSKEDQKALTPPVQNPVDYMTFTFDMSEKYTAGNYSFDLLGAAAEQKVTSGGYSTAQDLKFWHLFSQIVIKNIGFASGISGTVNKVHLKAYPSGEYIVSYGTDASNSTSPTKVECEVIKTTSNNTAVNKSDIIFNNPNFTSAAPIIHIIPQDVASLELYIDFTINEGTPQNPIPVQYQGFKIDVTAQELDEYVYNGKYNWSITIGTKNSISFEVIKVNEWIDGSTNNEFPLQ